MNASPAMQAAVAVFVGIFGGTLAGLLPWRRRGRARWAAVSAVRGLCGAALSTVLVVIPSAVFVRESLGNSQHQLGVPAVRLAPSAAARYRLLPPFHDAVPVLTYHNLADSGGRNTVSPKEFARHLAMLRAAGFSSITAVEFEHFLAGTGRLPAKPILITFDDGVSSTWRAADPILEHYRMNAVLFVITSEIGRHAPYYLSSHELRDLRDSGRWELEAHTDDGHGSIPASPSLKKAPFLTNREWLPAEDRYETLSEYEQRVAGDLDRSIEKLRALGVAPHLFAFPFSTASATTNDRRVVPILRRLVADRFPVSLVDSAQHRYVARDEDEAPSELPRFLITSAMSADDLFEELAASEPLPLPGNLTRPASNWLVEQDDLKSGLNAREGLTFAPPPRTWISARWKPRNALPMRNATLHVTAAHLGTATAGSAVTLVIRPDDNATPATVTVGPSTLRIQAATSLQCALPQASSHRLAVTYEGDTLQVAVDGRRAGTLHLAKPGGSGLALGAWRDSPKSPKPVIRQLIRDGGTVAQSPATGSKLKCTSKTKGTAGTQHARGGRLHAVQRLTPRGGRSRAYHRSTHRGTASSRTPSRSTWRSS